MTNCKKLSNKHKIAKRYNENIFLGTNFILNKNFLLAYTTKKKH